MNPNKKEIDKVHLKIEFKPKKVQQEIISYSTNTSDFGFEVLKDYKHTYNYSEAKYIVVSVFRQYGKSFCARYICLKWLSTKNTTVGYLTPTNRLGKEIYNAMLRIIPPPLIKRSNATDRIIELLNGSRILFFTAESIDTVRGFTLDYLIFDEAAHVKEYTPDGQHIFYNILSPLMDARGKKILFISTPNGAQGFFYDLYRKAMEGQKGYKFIKASVYDDETKTKEWIEELRANYSDIAFRQEYMCEFLTNGASCFTNFSSIFDADSFDYSQPIFVGIDFSSVGSDNTVITFVNSLKQVKQFIINGEIDEKYRKASTILNAHSNNIQKIVMETNSIGELMINEIKKQLSSNLVRLIEPFYTSNESKNDIINKLALDIEQNNIHCLKDDNELFSEMKTFVQRKTKSGKTTYAALDGYHDDRIMSLAFANYAHTKNNSYSSKEYMRILNF